ncbi:MAG TPA: hypothetical protein VH595_19235 [Verrucomicrobiae bacterium]|nr:hypothetical protein [Verrucomicrobiae bacterium]
MQGGGTASDASISQTGTIPASAQSLLFEEQGLQGAANPQLGVGNFAVLIGDQSIPLEVVSSGANYTLYGANISAWDGQSKELTFSAHLDLTP